MNIDDIDLVCLDVNGGVGDLISYYYGMGWGRTSYTYADDWKYLKGFKKNFPEKHVILIMNSLNPQLAQDFIKYFPFIDMIFLKNSAKKPYNNNEIYNLKKEYWITDYFKSIKSNHAPRDWDYYSFVLMHNSRVTLVNEFLKYCDIEPEKDIQVYISNQDYSEIQSLLEKKYIIFHPFADEKHRNCEKIGSNYPAFSEKKYSEVCNILAESGKNVYVLGGSGQEIPSLNHPNIINLCGKLNIRQSVYLTENCDGLVGSNSAMSCVTYSKKIPTVVLTPSYDNLEKGDIAVHPNKGPQVDMHIRRNGPENAYVFFERPSTFRYLKPEIVANKLLDLMKGVSGKINPYNLKFT